VNIFFNSRVYGDV